MATAQTAGHQLSPVELGAWRGFLRVHSALVKSLDAELASAHDLPLSSYEVLITLEASPGRKARMSELADSVLLSRSGMTRLVDRLEREGLLERDHCTADGRGCFAVLTEKGAAGCWRRRAATHLGGVRERFLSQFGDDELRMLATLWERVLPGASGTRVVSLSAHSCGRVSSSERAAVHVHGTAGSRRLRRRSGA